MTERDETPLSPTNQLRWRPKAIQELGALMEEGGKMDRCSGCWSVISEAHSMGYTKSDTGVYTAFWYLCEPCSDERAKELGPLPRTDCNGCGAKIEDGKGWWLNRVRFCDACDGGVQRVRDHAPTGSRGQTLVSWLREWAEARPGQDAVNFLRCAALVEKALEAGVAEDLPSILGGDS